MVLENLDALAEHQRGAGTSSNGAAPAEEATESSLGPIPDYPVDALPGAAQALVRYAERHGLPSALVAGAALAAMATAIGGASEIEIVPNWHQRAILWIPLVAPRGAGKSPSQDLAFGWLRAHDAGLDESEEESAVLLGDTTVEAIARDLAAMDGTAGVDLDELAVLLRGLGEYKRGQGSDRDRLLALWTGAPWSVSRVGSKGGKKNDVKLRISRPTLSICGGLQTHRHALLGGEEDGLRPRWLPHLAAMPEPSATEAASPFADQQAISDWGALLEGLIDNRKQPARRELSRAVRGRFEHYRRKWKTQARDGTETASTTAALVKADIQLARIALVQDLADPGRRDRVDGDHVDRGAQIVNFELDCWRALPEPGSLALSRRDEVLDRGIDRLIGWLEEHGGEANSRELQRAHVASVRAADDLKALLLRYENTYPGTVKRDVIPPGGGTPMTIVRAPIRGGV
jgi:hypothetical protein